MPSLRLKIYIRFRKKSDSTKYSIFLNFTGGWAHISGNRRWRHLKLRFLAILIALLARAAFKQYKIVNTCSTWPLIMIMVRK